MPRAHAVRSSPVGTAHLLLQEAKVELHQGRTRQCLRVLTRGLSTLDHAPDGGAVDPRAALTVRSRLESFYAWSRFRQGRYREASGWARTAEQHADAAGDTAALAEIYAVLQQVSTWSAHAADRPYGRLALELYESLGDRAQQANMLNNLAGEAFFDGHWTDALDMYARATARLRGGRQPARRPHRAVQPGRDPVPPAALRVGADPPAEGPPATPAGSATPTWPPPRPASSAGCSC